MKSILDLNLNTPALKRLLNLWLDEDIGRGDLSSSSLTDHYVKAYWIAKQEGVFCGGCVVERLFKILDQLHLPGE